MGAESRWIASWALLALFIEVAVCFRCNAGPIKVPIGDIKLSTGQSRRGAALAMGTPYQQFSNKVYVQNANTLLKMTTDGRCGAPDAKCVMERGGGYDRRTSETWSGKIEPDEFEGFNREYADVYAQETVEIGGTKVANFPFGIVHDTEYKHNGFGLSRDSVLLDFFGRNQLISARSWSFYYGMTGDESREGHLMLGGYDRAKRSNNAFISKMTYEGNCLMIVEITGMKFKNGGNEVDILNGEKARGCIRPDYELISMPGGLFDKFNKASGNKYSKKSTGLYPTGFEISKDDIFQGNLEIVLGDKPFDIKNSQLNSKNLDYNDQGRLVEQNSNRVLRIKAQGSHENSNLVYLGGPFLSAAYLYVNYESGNFAVYPVKHTDDEEISPEAGKECNDNAPPKDLLTPKRLESKNGGGNGGSGGGGGNGGGKSNEDIDKEIEEELKGEPIRPSKPAQPPSDSPSGGQDSDDSSSSPSRPVSSRPSNGGSGSSGSSPSSPGRSSSSSPSRPPSSSNDDDDDDEFGGNDYYYDGDEGYNGQPRINGGGSGGGPASSEADRNAAEKSKAGDLDTKDSESSGPSGAVIGGAVAGGVVAILAGILFFICMRRRKQQEARHYSNVETGTGKFGSEANTSSRQGHHDETAAGNSHYAPHDKRPVNYEEALEAPSENSPSTYGQDRKYPVQLPTSNYHDEPGYSHQGYSTAPSELGTYSPNDSATMAANTAYSPAMTATTRGGVEQYELEAPVSELPAYHGRDPSKLGKMF